MKNLFYLFLAFILLFSSCTDDEDCCVLPPEPYEAGAFVLNQGSFGNGSGSITYIDNDGNVEQDIFQTVNSRPIGNVVQSMAFDNGKGFIMVNNAAKAEVVDAGTFESVATIENLAQPRYYVGSNSNKGYISQWGSDGLTGAVHVIDLSNHSIAQTITTRSGAERMLINGTDLLVANSGGFGVDSTITVINTATDMVSQTIELGKNPVSIASESDGDVWVICAGTFGGTLGSIYELNGNDYTIKRSYDFSQNAFGSNLLIHPTSGKIAFTLSGGVYTIDPSATSLAPSQISTSSFYGIGMDTSGNIYGADAKDFASTGEAVVMDFNGTVQSTYTAGLIPGNFAFK